jgi:hypothetical protein
VQGEQVQGEQVQGEQVQGEQVQGEELQGELARAGVRLIAAGGRRSPVVRPDSL